MAVGKAACAWNMLHESLRQLFAALSDDRDAATAEWYSLRNDRAQRGMLKKLLSRTPGNTRSVVPKLKPDGLWLLARADELAEDRNNAVHTPATLYVEAGSSVMGPAFMHGHPRANSLRGRNLLEEFAWCEGSTDILTRFVRAIETSYGYPDRYAWPERPKLPAKP